MIPTDFQIPTPEGVELAPYQDEGVRYALQRKVTLIADEPGVGKTAQAVAFVNCFLPKRVLIICPASLKVNWSREWAKFTVHDEMSVGIAFSKKGWPDADVVIVNFERLKKYDSEIKAHTWDVVIIDEAHYIKNPDAERTQCILGRRAKRKHKKRPAQEAIAPLRFKKLLMLTGTPLLNQPVDLWVLCQLADPTGLGADYMKFTKRYCAGWNAPWGYDTTGASNLDELKRLLKERFMIRRHKADVLKSLPAKRRVVLELPTDGLNVSTLLKREIALYDRASQVTDVTADFEEQVAKLKDQQVSEVVEVVEDLAATRQEVALKKLPMVFEFVDNLLDQGEKVIVFAHHHAVADALWGRYGETAAIITGKVTGDTKRQAQVDKFQNDPNCRVFIGQIKAAGVGHTLTAAYSVVFAEIDYTPANLEQAEDRAHRRGQLNAVTAYYLVLEGSLDAGIIQKVVEKQSVISQAIND